MRHAKSPSQPQSRATRRRHAARASALILAGAGSGKTRVLTTRIAWLIQTGQVSPGGVLAVTFTNKAAKEMLTRLDAMLPINVRGMWIGTFHGLCNRFLRAHWTARRAAAGASRSSTRSDQLSADQAPVKAMQRRRGALSAEAADVVHRRRQGRRPARQGRRSVNDEQSRKLVEIYEAYDEQCQREGVVDFAELLLRTYELLRDNEPLREHYQRRFRHILVDEFQDTNRPAVRLAEDVRRAAEHGARCSRSATTTRASTPSAARKSATWRDFEREFHVENRDQAGAELPLARQHPRRGQRADRATTASAWARTCAPTPARASRCASTKRQSDLARGAVDRRRSASA